MPISPPSPSQTNTLIERKRRHLMPCYQNFYAHPLWIARASMQHVYDGNDARYLDCYSGVGVVGCGHCNPEIHAKTFEASSRLDHTTTIYLTEPIIRLAERLADLTPEPLQKVFFCSSGSEANEVSALIATLSTGRSKFLAFDLGLHGRTLLTMNLTGLPVWRTDTSLSDRVLHLPTPNCRRCPYGKTFPACELACAHEAARTIEAAGPEDFAALIAEPVLGNGGMIPVPPGWFEVVSATLREHGILLIVDEVQTGFGRTGAWFGIDHHDVAPDVMSVAKALGNGVPIGASIATDDAAAAYSRPGASTFGGNITSTAAAHATLDYMEANRLPARARELGAHLRAGLEELAERRPVVGDVRGLGLMLGVELVDSEGREDTAAAEAALESLRERGFLVGRTGLRRNVLALMPPLIVERSDLDELLVNLDAVLGELERRP